MRTFLVVVLCLSVALATPPVKFHKKLRSNTFKFPRIINGDQAVAGQFPWQASLSLNDGSRGWFCGGAIISEEWILTSGNCVVDALNGKIRTGTLEPKHGGILTDATKFILHEAFNPLGLVNDIGLIQLAEPLTFDENTQAISLSEEDLGVDVEVTVSGWGVEHDGDTAVVQYLNFVNLVTIDNAECFASYGGLVSDGQVCAKSGDATVRSTCNGDSGGPLITNADSNPVHVGIVSFIHIDGCESGHPAGFTRTNLYRDWIKTNSGV